MYRVVQPWGRDKARQATVVSQHHTSKAAFSAIDRVAALAARNGTDAGHLELLVVDDEGRIMRRPDAH
jgi:hypothetical protein